MINEGQVALMWQRLFAEQGITPQCLSRAEELIDELRAESPLRFRLEQELREIRLLLSPDTAVAKRTKRKQPAK